MAIATLNISLPDTMKADVEEIVATEGYGNTSEFFRDLVRDFLRKRDDRKLEALILEGLNSGEAKPFTKEDMDAIRNRGLERIRQRRQFSK
jgi:antitoxin ParD1/3/4